MAQRNLLSLLRNTSAAVAPTVALSLFGLIAAGGLAFDYARMASLDTDLQNAADQAALAAASQLDGQVTACDRASAAARALVSNQTRFSNDGNGVAVTVANETGCGTGGFVKFYEDKLHTVAASTDATAKFVQVTVNSRSATYAMTPVVQLFTSGAMRGTAFAGLGSAVCKVPPLMFCNPDEPVGNTDVNYGFNANSRIGVGMRLVGDGSYAPGNFGFLETGGSGANVLLAALGWNTPPGDCVATTGVETKTGISASVFDGLNTRFDINANGNSCPGGDANCSPSVNVRKDLVRGNQCGITGNGWEENAASNGNFTDRRYRPPSAATVSNTPEIMGLPRDLCHAWDKAGNCTGGAGGRMGNGQWDINAYWRSHYGANYASQVSAGTYGAQPLGYPTRYQVYRWEIDDLTRISTPKASSSAGKSAYSKPVAATCLATPSSPYGIVPGGTNVDRRRLSSAVINCRATGLSGHQSDLPVVKWIDLFLVEPSFARSKCSSGAGCNTSYTDKTDLYVEIIGETNSGAAGSTAGQVVRRDAPYLIE
jgi:Flp pilus assembly protein TadG